MGESDHKKEFLLASEVAEWLRVSPRTIRLWSSMYVDSGGAEGIPCSRVGNLWRYREHEVRAWFECRGTTSVQLQPHKKTG
jgi:hypothetical protein